MGGGFDGMHEPMGCDFGALFLPQKTSHPIKTVYAHIKDCKKAINTI